MKNNLAFALAAVLAATPVLTLTAADAAKASAKEEVAETEGPTPAQLKARKLVKAKPVQVKFDAAKKLAEESGMPMIVAVLPPKTPAIDLLEKRVLKRKEFVTDFLPQNCLLMLMKVKQDGKDPKRIDTKPLKEGEIKFLENYAVSDHAIAMAKQLKKDEPKYTDLSCYPMVVCVDSMCQKELFRLGPYDQDGGFGVWISQLADCFRKAGIEPKISPNIQKMIDDPDNPKLKK